MHKRKVLFFFGSVFSFHTLQAKVSYLEDYFVLVPDIRISKAINIQYHFIVNKISTPIV